MRSGLIEQEVQREEVLRAHAKVHHALQTVGLHSSYDHISCMMVWRKVENNGKIHTLRVVHLMWLRRDAWTVMKVGNALTTGSAHDTARELSLDEAVQLAAQYAAEAEAEGLNMRTER